MLSFSSPVRRKSFFDALSAPVLEHIARFVSSHPRRFNWEAHVKASDALTLLTSIPCLRASVIHRFTTLSLVDDNGTPAACGAIAHVGNCPLADFFHALGSGLLKLVIDYTYELPFDRAWLGTFATKCTAVKEVEVRRVPFCLSLLLRAARGRLAALTLSDAVQRPRVDVITQTCPGIRKLYLGANTLVFPLVAALGYGLEELSFRVCAFNPAGIAHVQKFCRRLRKLHFIGAPIELSGKVTALVVSYGAQLEVLRFSDGLFLPEHLTVISAICTNVRIDASLPPEAPEEVLQALEQGILEPGTMERPIFVDAVRAMGARLYTLRWSGGRYSTESAPVCLECPNLQSICLTGMDASSVDALRAVIGKGDSQLRDVNLSFADTDVDEDTAFEEGLEVCVEAEHTLSAIALLANHCQRIQRIRFESVPIDSAPLFDLAQANSDLEYVDVVFKKGRRGLRRFRNADSASLEMHLLKAIAAFVSCGNLKCMAVSDLSYSGIAVRNIIFPEVVELLSPLRHQMVSLEVFGVEYFS